MVRWIGFVLLITSAPLFFTARGRWLKRSRVIYRRLTTGAVFMMGILGLCMLIFGHGKEAVIVLATWTFIAWLYNL